MQSIQNSVRLIGLVAANPEIRQTPGNMKMAGFSLGTTETNIDEKGNKVLDIQWHNIVAWGKTAEIIEEFVTKGTTLAVEGKLIVRPCKAKDSEQKFITEVLIDDFLLLSYCPTPTQQGT